MLAVPLPPVYRFSTPGPAERGPAKLGLAASSALPLARRRIDSLFFALTRVVVEYPFAQSDR